MEDETVARAAGEGVTCQRTGLGFTAAVACAARVRAARVREAQSCAHPLALAAAHLLLPEGEEAAEAVAVCDAHGVIDEGQIPPAVLARLGPEHRVGADDVAARRHETEHRLLGHDLHCATRRARGGVRDGVGESTADGCEGGRRARASPTTRIRLAGRGRDVARASALT